MSSSTGVSVQWKWAAAVYPASHFSTDDNALGVKPVDDNTNSQYKNSDHAGTPENYKSYVIGGATGGGGSNYTGGYSGTASVTLNTNTPMLAAPLTTNGGSSQAILTAQSSSSAVGNGPTLQTDSVLSRLVPEWANSTDSASPNAASWSAFQARMSVESVQRQQTDALALQRLDVLLSIEAGAMGVTKDTLARDLFFASLFPPHDM
jgi:hypothetical protein